MPGSARPTAPTVARGWRVLAPVVVVGVLGALLTAMAVSARVTALSEQAEREVAETVSADAAALAAELQQLYGAMQSVAGFFAAVGQPTEEEFRAFAAGIVQDHPEVQAVQYSQRITADQRPALEAELQRRGVAQTVIEPAEEGGVRPAGDRPEYVVITYNEPADPNREVFGFDITYRPANGATVAAARDTGQVQVGGRTVLVQGGGSLEALHLYAPIYDTPAGTAPETLAERRASFEGIAGAVVLYPELMASLNAGANPDVDEALLDVTEDAVTPTVLWRSPGAAEVSAAELAAWPVQEPVETEGRELMMVGRSASGAALGQFPSPLMIGLVGAALTALLCGLVWTWLDAKRQARLARDLDQATARLQLLADRDALTGLPHRDRLRVWAQERLLTDPSTGLAVMFVDLDGFRDVNSTLGHPAGDSVLVDVGHRLAAWAGEDCLVARVGGDEFVVVLCGGESATSPEVVSEVAHGLQRTIADPPVPVLGRELLLTASIGIAMRPRDGDTLEELLTHADAAVREAKRGPRGRICGFTPAMATSLTLRQQLSDDVQRVARDPGDQLRLAYQPQVDMRTGQVVGAEALLRWHHPELGLVSPADFIPIAEETGAIRAIGDWVVTEALEQLRRWQDAGLALPKVSVNVAPQQLADESLVVHVMAALAGVGFSPERLEVEITESTAMSPGESQVVAHMAQRGVAVAIDDFGSGYSSLSRLGDVPASTLKIDRTFVARIGQTDTGMEVIRAILALASALDMTVVAEGIETDAQARALLAEGVVIAQGFRFGRPADPDAFARSITDGRVALPVDASG